MHGGGPGGSGTLDNLDHSTHKRSSAVKNITTQQQALKQQGISLCQRGCCHFISLLACDFQNGLNCCLGAILLCMHACVLTEYV